MNIIYIYAHQSKIIKTHVVSFCVELYIYMRVNTYQKTRAKLQEQNPLEQTNKKVGCQALITTWHHVKSVWTWDIPEYVYIYKLYIYILYIYCFIFILYYIILYYIILYHIISYNIYYIYIYIIIIYIYMQISMEKSWATIGFWGYLISRGDLGPRLFLCPRRVPRIRLKWDPQNRCLSLQHFWKDVKKPKYCRALDSYILESHATLWRYLKSQ
jgi:hypothetical protein